MANSELGLTGLRPYGRVKPDAIQYFRVNTAINLFRFMPVVLNNSGQVVPAEVVVDASGILGTTIGFLSTGQDGLPTNLTDLNQGAFLDLSNNALAAVIIDEDQLYTLESDTGGTIIGSENSAGQTVHFTYHGSGTGNTTTGIANTLLDQSTLATDTGGNLLLVRPYREYVNPDGTLNDVSLNFSKWVVKIYKSPVGVFAANPTDRPS